MKLGRVTAEIIRGFNTLVTRQPGGRITPAVASAVQDWAQAQGVATADALAPGEAADDSTPWVIFLKQHDIGFRIRRLRFVIRRLNQLYTQMNAELTHAHVDGVKQALYRCLSPLLARQQMAHLPPDERARLAADIVASDGPHDACMKTRAAALALDMADRHTDQELAAALATNLPTLVRETVLRSYLGFPFYDIAVLPMQQEGGSDDFEDIKIDRISPDDCTSLRIGRMSPPLRGTRFGSFGAFFSRTYRENDYLWGRLNGVERLIDIIASSVDAAQLPPATVVTWKHAAFRAILHAERKNLGKISSLIDQLLAEIDNSTGAPPDLA